MLNRECKKCGGKLSSSSNYFCSACGEKLPPELVLEPKITGQKKVPYEVEIKRKNMFSCFSSRFNIPFSYCLLPILLLFMLLGYYTYSKYYALSNNYEVSKEVVECNSDFKCGNFGNSNLVKVVPHDVVIYLEGFDVNKFSQLFLEMFPQHTTLFEELLSLDSSHFVVFGENIGGVTYWTLVISSDKNPSTTLIGYINNPKDIYVGKLDNMYIVSTRSTVINDMQNVLAGLSKDISQVPTYAIASKKAENLNTLLLLVPDTIGKDILHNMVESNKLTGYFKDVANQLIKSSEDYIIIK